MKKMMIPLLSLFALMCISTQAMAAEEKDLWEQTKQGAITMIEWTTETSKKGWQATKEGASDLAAWTAEKSSQGWESASKLTN